MVYKTNVLEIGSMVPAFAEEMLIVLFGTTAPNELRDISVIHEPESNSQKNILKVGTRLEMGGQTYEVTAVGNAANANFDELGHVSIYFKDTDDLLPGAISVQPSIFPDVKVSEVIKFSND